MFNILFPFLEAKLKAAEFKEQERKRKEKFRDEVSLFIVPRDIQQPMMF